MLADENLNEKDKEWVSGFLQNDVMNGDPKDQDSLMDVVVIREYSM